MYIPVPVVIYLYLQRSMAHWPSRVTRVLREVRISVVDWMRAPKLLLSVAFLTVKNCQLMKRLLHGTTKPFTTSTIYPGRVLILSSAVSMQDQFIILH